MSYNEDMQKTDELGKEDCILEPEVIVTVKEETKDGDGVITMHNDNTSESNKNFEFVVVKDEPEDVVTGGEEDGLEDIEILERKSFHKGHKTDMGTTAQQKEKSYGKHVSVVKEKKAVAASKISAGSKQNQMHFVDDAQAGPSTSVIGKSVLNNIRQRGNQIVYGTGLKRTIGKFICKHCGNIFETFLDFEVHVKSHISEKPFTCPCGRSYMHKGHLKEHMLTHTDKKPHTCSECSKSFAHKGDLTIHMRIHTGEKPYSCTECGKCFVQGGQLKMHMRTHTGEKPYSCSVCGKSFVQKHNMLDHMFLHTGEKPYSCNQCGRSFVQGCHLKDHMKTHSGEKPYSCTFCGKSFLQNSDLRVHVRGHTGEKPFSCSNCGKSFARSGVLKRHMLTHTGEKPYKCEECGKQYTQSSKLKRHMGIQHNKSIISPEVVSKSVISPEVVIIPSISCNDGVQQKDVYDGSIISNLSGRDLGPLSKDSICKQYTQSSKLKRHMGIQHNKSIISPEVVSKSVISPEVVIIPSISCNDGVQQKDV